MKTAAEVAAELVTVTTDRHPYISGSWVRRVRAFGLATREIEFGEDERPFMARACSHIAAALEAHAAEARREVLRGGMAECQVSEERLEEVQRAHGKWESSQLDEIESKTDLRGHRRDLLQVVDHLRSVVAMLTNDHRNDDGPYRAGRKIMRAECLEAVCAWVDELNRQWDRTTVSNAYGPWLRGGVVKVIEGVTL